MKISADAFIDRMEQLGFIFAVAMDKSGNPAGVYTGFPDDAQAEHAEGAQALAMADAEKDFTTQELAAAILARRNSH
jgi:hypothetical protein